MIYNTLQDEETPQSQMLTDFSEGSVGKFVIRKSGRAQLLMGNITMDVAMGTKCGFLQVCICKFKNMYY
jgi:DNA-directed RNA polymerase III subunit RPC4